MVSKKFGFQKGHKFGVGKKNALGYKRTAEQKRNNSRASLLMWQNPEYAKKVLCVDSPNKEEKRLMVILNDILPNTYTFVGNGKLKVGSKYPDFVDSSNVRLIELYGDYYHKGQNPQDRIDYFEQFGYNTLVIWASELKDTTTLKNKIMAFN